MPLVLLVNFVGRFRLELMYISLIIRITSSLIYSMVFSSLHCCHSSQKSLYQQNKSCESKIKFRQASNHCKRVLEAAKLHMLVKQKTPSLPRNLALGIGNLLIVFLTKVNLLYLIYSLTQRHCILHSVSDKAKLFAKTLTGISLPAFLLELL